MKQAEKPVFPPLEAQGWPIVRDWARLDDLCEGIFDCPHTTPQITDEGPYVVRSQDVRAGVFRMDQAAHVSEETYLERIARAEPRFGDILYSREGTYFGLAAEVPPDVRVCLGQRMVLIRPKVNLHTRFLRFWLNSPILHKHIMGFRDGTVAERLNMPTIRGLPVPITPLPEQRAIAHVLGTLDDKIDLNRRMNATLEAMARALFKDWFVDFGPTRAKMEGHAPYLAPDLWALFPDRLDEEGKPEGWELGAMSDLLVLQRGFDLPSQDRINGPYPIIAASGPNGFHNASMVKGPGVTTGRSGVLGKVFFVHEDFWPLNTSLWVKEFIRSTPSYAYFYLQEVDFEGFNAGSAVPTLNRNHIHRLPSIIPPDDLIQAFDEAAMALLTRQESNKLESRTLAQTRDLLLPKLMSGEVRLNPADFEVLADTPQ